MTEENILGTNLKGGWRKRGDKIFPIVVGIVLFLLPWQTRYIFREAPLYEWGTLSIYGIEILVWIMIVFGLLQIRNVKCKMKNVKWLWLLVGLTAISFLSIFWAPDKLIALQAAVRLYEGVLLFLIVRQAPIAKHWATQCLAMGAVIQSILGIYQFFAQSSFASTLLGMASHDSGLLGSAVVEVASGRWLRAYGGLPHPNALGGYLVIALAALVLGIRNYESPHQNKFGAGQVGIRGWVWWGSIFILLTGIFFTFSRTAWIAAGIVLMIGLIRQIRPIGRIIVVGWIAALTVIYWPLVAARVMPASAERLEIKSRVERVQGIRESWALIKQRPMLGAGIGNYTQAIKRDVRQNNPLYSYQPVHNVFLLILAELGIAGLTLFITVLYFIFKQSKCLILNSLFLILLSLDHYLWSLPFGVLLFWGILGLSTALLAGGLDKKTLL